MARWQSRIDIADVWQNAKAGDIEAPELGKAIAACIRASNAWERWNGWPQEQLEMLADAFEDCRDMDEIDDQMRELYDWGDEALDDNWAGRKRCWIDTFRKAQAGK